MGKNLPARAGTDATAASEPIVLLGRGGSGTRLLSQAVLSLGVFLGNELNVSSDSVEWVDDLYALAAERLTRGILPGSDGDRAWRQRLRARAAAILTVAGRTPGDAWGWKVPETMLVVPDVLRAFPNARFVHLVRHPVTSAWRRTHLTSRVGTQVGEASLSSAYRSAGRDPAGMDRDEAWFHNAITWRHQVGQVQSVLSGLGPRRVLVVRYEDLCRSPAAARRDVAGFLGIADAGAPSLPVIDPGRTGGAPPDPAIVDVIWKLCGEVAVPYGYTRDDVVRMPTCPPGPGTAPDRRD